MTKICFHCKIREAKYIQGTSCHTCYYRFRRIGSFYLIEKYCEKCSGKLGGNNKSGFCDNCHYDATYDEFYAKQKIRIAKKSNDVKAYQKQYRSEHKEENKEYKRNYYINNKKEILCEQKQTYLDNKDIIKERTKVWRKSNPKKRYASDKLRQERKRFNLTKDQKKEIKEFYINCPKGYTVDHIIPLNGDNVCGLHVLWNLQYLIPTENFQKSNKFDGTYNNESWKTSIIINS